MVGFRFHLPIKESEKSRTRNDRSGSAKSTKNRHSPDLALKNKHKLSEGSNSKKHKFSLCSNGSLDYGNEENNLYKKLLKSKYKF